LSVKRIRAPIKRVLIPTDGSDASFNSIFQGVRFAAMLRAEVVGLHAIDPKEHHEARAHAHGTPYSQIRDSHPELTRQVDEIFLPFYQIRKTTSIAINTTATVGEPADVILQAAEVLACDAIVMGTSRGLSKDRPVFAGSVARAVFSRSAVPVLVLPPGAQIQTEEDDRDVVMIGGEMTTRPRLLVGVDGGQGSIELAAEAVRFARALQAEIYFMHAGHQGPEITTILESLKEAAKQYWLPVRDRNVQGDAVEAAIQIADKEHIDFFVFGTRMRHKKGLMARLQEAAAERGGFFGSTSDALVHRAERPVLIVHLPEV
jgi:nucleotide-binding universal stress UspA family protein